MIRSLAALLTGASFAALATSAMAQGIPGGSADPAARAQEANDAIERAGNSAEIIVTARRRDESLQDVPQTVNAVTAETLEKLNIQKFEDIETIVPGLNLEGGSNGFSTTASIRGATFNIETGAKPTVVFYINEAPIESNIIFTSMFDVGQIEVLRGPQGTLRGRSAPSGAITISSRRPNLNEAGGALNGSLNEFGSANLQAALNIPIIADVLAVRLAGVYDHNDFDGIKSVNNPSEPFSKTHGGRITVRFEPTSTLSATVMYQILQRDISRYTQVTGTGGRGGVTPIYTLGALTYPSRAAPAAGYNGPPIDPEDRLGVGEDPLQLFQTFKVLTGNVDWEFAGQKLSYVGSWSKAVTDSLGGGDPLNSYRGSISQILDNTSVYTSHELRLSSAERIADMFDYTLGAFYFQEKVNTHTTQFRFNPGAFGPLPANTGIAMPLIQPDPAYISALDIRRQGKTRELAFFGSLTAHLGERTEITGGLRHIIWKENPQGPFFPNATLTPTQLFGQGSTLCLSAASARIPTGQVIQTPATCIPNASDTVPSKVTAWVWNVSASHKFSRDFMVYATVGTSWRAGPYTVVTSELEAPGLASSNDLRFHDPERARSYELGFKSTFLDGRARLNVAAYYQTFKDYFYFTPGSTYRLGFTATRVPNSVGTFRFTANADAKAYGVDIDTAFQITPEWSLSGAFSWAKGEVDNDDVPCNDGNFDGTPDNIVPTVQGFVAAGVIVARCRTNASISQSPRWNMSLQSEYARPVMDRIDGFLRGQFTYYPKNPFKTDDLVIDNYGILNLYTGLRAPDNSWEVSFFAKNILNTKKIVDFDLNTIPNDFYGDPGYSTVTLTPRREFGVNLRVAFGSR